MSYVLDIQKVILEIEDTPKISDRLQLIKKAIQIADVHNDIDWGFDLRLLLINTENFTSRSVLSYPAFSWILDINDANRGYFDENDFMYEYKWMFAISYGSYSISKEQFMHIGEDFHQRLLNNGYSSRGYYQIMGIWYQHLREYKKASDIIAKMEQCSLDEMSNNLLFETALKANNLLACKKYDEAFVVAQDLFHNRFDYVETAFEAYVLFAFEFYKVNDQRFQEYFDLATRHIISYDEDDCITHIRARILYMYLLYKNGDEKCWDYFEEICVYEHEAEDFYSFFFVKYATCLLQEKGQRHFNFPTYLPYYDEKGIYDLEELYLHFKKRAFHYAASFDKRNGNTNFIKELNELLGLE